MIRNPSNNDVKYDYAFIEMWSVDMIRHLHTDVSDTKHCMFQNSPSKMHHSIRTIHCTTRLNLMY